MKLKSVKKASDLVLEGIKIEIDTVDHSQKAVTFTDVKGNVVRVAHRDYNSLSVEVPAPPEMEKKFKLSGTVLGLPVDKLFDDQFEARNELERLESEVRNEDERSLKVEQVDVPVAA